MKRKEGKEKKHEEGGRRCNYGGGQSPARDTPPFKDHKSPNLPTPLLHTHTHNPPDLYVNRLIKSIPEGRLEQEQRQFRIDWWKKGREKLISSIKIGFSEISSIKLAWEKVLRSHSVPPSNIKKAIDPETKKNRENNTKRGKKRKVDYNRPANCYSTTIFLFSFFFFFNK